MCVRERERDERERTRRENGHAFTRTRTRSAANCAPAAKRGTRCRKSWSARSTAYRASIDLFRVPRQSRRRHLLRSASFRVPCRRRRRCSCWRCLMSRLHTTLRNHGLRRAIARLFRGRGGVLRRRTQGDRRRLRTRPQRPQPRPLRRRGRSGGWGAWWRVRERTPRRTRRGGLRRRRCRPGAPLLARQ